MYSFKVLQEEGPCFGHHLRAAMNRPKLQDPQAVCCIYLVLKVPAAHGSHCLELQLAGGADQTLHVTLVDCQFAGVGKVQQAAENIRINILKLHTCSYALLAAVCDRHVEFAILLDVNKAQPAVVVVVVTTGQLHWCTGWYMSVTKF